MSQVCFGQARMSGDAEADVAAVNLGHPVIMIGAVDGDEASAYSRGYQLHG